MLSIKEALTALFGVLLMAAGLWGSSGLLWFALVNPFAWHTIADLLVGLFGGLSLIGLGARLAELN